MTKKIILLAEDDQDDRIIFLEAFQELNSTDVKLEAVEDGIDVVNRLKDIRHEEDLPQLFILDQNMPKMTGKATLTFLKSHDRFKHIPVVIYSTYPDATLINEFIRLGADQVVAKPDSYEGFKEMVHAFVNTYLTGAAISQERNR